jgi:predicted HTH transcriptional regulator
LRNIFLYQFMKTAITEPAHYIKGLIQEGEHRQLDFKFEISDAKKIARTFSAFANTVGGRLLIGVKDNGRISGVRSEEEAYMAESAAHLFCKPAVDFDIKKWVIEGKCVLEVIIAASKRRPHYAKNDDGQWIAFVRVGDQNIKANRILLNVWKSELGSKGVLVNYGKEERALIDYLSQNDRITMNRFMKVARIDRFQAERILTNLILINVISMELTEKAAFYSLNKTKSP